MKKFFATLLIAANLFFVSTANAEVETYTGEGKATMSEAETLEKVIERAKTYALRNAREKAGVYIRSQSRLRDLELVEDEVVTLASGILKITATKTEKTLLNEAIQVFVTLTVTVDSNDLQREIDKFLAQNPNRKSAPKPEPVVEQPPPPPQSEQSAPTPPVEKIIAKSITLEKRGDFKGALKLLNDTAIVDYTKAIELAPNNGLYYLKRAIAYRNYGDYNKAIADLKRAKELGYLN